SAILSSIVVTILAAAPAAAAKQSSTEESIGVTSGALVGAVTGGPVGLLFGAAIGGKLGDTIAQKNARLEGLKGELDDSNAQVASLENSIDTMGEEIERLQDVARPQLVNLLQAGIAMDLLFRTDEFALADTTGDRLAGLARTLATMPDIRVQLDGFADERGDAQYNLALSEKRVEFVRQLLLEAGVQADRIDVAAHGESVAQDTNPDSYALERRVSVRLFINDAESLAANDNPPSL
ncbi:MAG: OmpA family protein, partial [Woeseiaceae bacterium]|nr:OmpA family protein [Woeseiaceae bacterium]